jgi:hypothetical protein
MSRALVPLEREELVPVHVLRVDIGGAVIQTRVYFSDDGQHVSIPIRGQLPHGGYCNAIIQCDRDTYDRAKAFAQARGLNALRLADIAERALGHRPLLTIEPRELISRGED